VPEGFRATFWQNSHHFFGKINQLLSVNDVERYDKFVQPISEFLQIFSLE
jgi:hypothetical protein